MLNDAMASAEASRFRASGRVAAGRRPIGAQPADFGGAARRLVRKSQGKEMRPEVFWIRTQLLGRLAIMPRPRAGEWLDDEITGWKTEGIDTVVSLLELDEISELSLEREAELSRDHGIEFISFPIPDRGLPASLRDATTLAQAVASQVREGRAVAIHCRAGIGRSSLIAASVLIFSGLSADDAFRLISIARGINVPDTESQREWVMAFGQATATGA